MKKENEKIIEIGFQNETIQDCTDYENVIEKVVKDEVPLKNVSVLLTNFSLTKLNYN